MADPTTLGDYIDQQAIRYNVPVDLVNAILDQESDGVHARNGQITTSPQGAVGMFQLLPSTALGEFKLDASDPFQNAEAGIRYLRKGLDATNNDPIGAAAFYHGGPNLVQHGAKTRQYAADIDRRLRQKLNVAADPAASNAAAGLPPKFTPPPPPPPPPPSQPFQTTPRTPTAWERWTGTTTEIPPDVAASMAGNPADMRDQLWENTKKMGQAFDPREREGRRNIAATAVGVALTPAVLAGLATALGVSSVGALIAMGTSAVLAGTAGSTEEWLEQMVEKHGIPSGLGGFDTSGVKPTREALDYPEIAGAFGEQAAYDAGGHLILGTGRAVARHGLGPGIMRRAVEGFADERLLTLKTIQAAIDELKTGLRNFTFKTAEKGAAARAATQDATDLLRAQKAEAVDTARAQAESTLGVAKETGRRNVAAGEEQLRTDVATATGEGQVAQTQLGDQFNTAVGPPISEPATGRAVVATLEGPGQAAHDILGKAVDVEAGRGGPINIQAIQDEARRLFAEEVLPPEQAFPRAAPVAGTPPPVFSPKFRQAVSEAELQGAASHPAMPTIDRLLNAAPTVDSAELHAWYKRLAGAIDWENPAAGTVEGARKRLVGMMREALGANNPSYDAAARAYEESYTRMKRGYAADIAKAAVDSPERAVQMIHPNDPTMTEHLMSTLRQHTPHVADAVKNAWLQRNILRGGLDGLGQRLRILTDAPEFTRSLLGPTHAAEMNTLRGYASAWDDLVRESAAHTAATEAGTVVAGTSAAGPVTVGGRRGVEAAKQLGAQRVGDTRAAGTAAVDTARKTGQAAIDVEKKAFRGTARERASDLRRGKLEYQEAVQGQRVKGRAAQEISEEEAIALSHASSAARTFVDAFRGIGFPKTPSGALGLFRMLMGPNSEQLLRVAAARPEIGRHLVDWLADPNVRASYRIAKRFVGTEVGYHEAKPALEKYRQGQVGKPPPKPGETKAIIAVAPPRR